MADATSIKCRTFGDMVSIAENRANIAGTVQDRDRNFIKGALNEWYMKIGTEREWFWRKFDRDFVMDVATTTGTVSVTADSRVATFSTYDVTTTDLGKSFKVDGEDDLYRVVATNATADSVGISAPFVGTTNATATYKPYRYEFALPPDCDSIVQIWINNTLNYYGTDAFQLDPINPMEFNRLLASEPQFTGVPRYWCREGKIKELYGAELDDFVTNYDFLSGDQDDGLDRVRIWPIEPDRKRVIHLNYTTHITEMVEDADEPLIPVDDRWVLVNFALSEWFGARGNGTMADRYFSRGKNQLKEMRTEHKKSDVRPKFINPLSNYAKRRNYYDRDRVVIIDRT